MYKGCITLYDVCILVNKSKKKMNPPTIYVEEKILEIAKIIDAIRLYNYNFSTCAPYL